MFCGSGQTLFSQTEVGSEEITLKWGEDLKFFRPRMTLAEQVDEVMVRGWDPKKMEAIVGSASSGKLYPKIGESKDGASWSDKCLGLVKKLLPINRFIPRRKRQRWLRPV
jgi:hypothetical protein